MKQESAQQPKPRHHGPDHSPGNEDPTYPGPEVNVWSDAVSGWENGWDDPHITIGGGPLYLFSRSWFRLIDGDYGNPLQALELRLTADGGTPGTRMFTLPDGYYDWCKGKRIPMTYIGGPNGDTVKCCYVDGANGHVVDQPQPGPAQGRYECMSLTLPAGGLGANVLWTQTSTNGIFDLSTPGFPQALVNGAYAVSAIIEGGIGWTPGAILVGILSFAASYQISVRFEQVADAGGFMPAFFLSQTWPLNAGNQFWIELQNNDSVDHDVAIEPISAFRIVQYP